MGLNPIKPKEVLYIKLGRNGKWEEECLDKGFLQFSFREVSHELCLEAVKNQDWESVQKAWQQAGKIPRVASSHTNQSRRFYEADESTLWVTFSKDLLWWCFAKPEVIQLADSETKIRHTVSGWKCKNTNGELLSRNQLSGGLLAMQGFMGTICTVKEADYLVNKINSNEPADISLAVNALAELEARLVKVIQRLTPKDFEILTDLIFRQMGCQRVSVLGETMKDLDLVLRSPMDDELYGVQVKSRATRRMFEYFKEEQVKGMTGLSRFYFVTHTPNFNPLDLSELEAENVKLLLAADIARLSVRHGLTQWIIDKAQ